jgi:hypothetical protein
MEEKPKRQRVIFPNCQAKVDEVAKLKSKIDNAKSKIKALRVEISACQKEERKAARRKDPETVRAARQQRGRELAAAMKKKKEAAMV